MKAMFLGFAAAVAIAVVTGLVLSNANPGSDERYAAADVRLD